MTETSKNPVVDWSKFFGGGNTVETDLREVVEKKLREFLSQNTYTADFNLEAFDAQGRQVDAGFRFLCEANLMKRAAEERKRS